MNKRIKENISSDYVDAINRMRPKKAPRKIVAYVESYDDIFFWRSILSAYEDDTRYFEVMLPSKRSLSKGKRQALTSLIAKTAGAYMIACVDADYDYLLLGKTEMSAIVRDNPYVFHTYAYAIENLQCYAPSLHDVCVMVTLNDRAIFDFKTYLATFSETIYPLFLWNIWHYRSNRYTDFTITDLCKVIELGRFHLDKPYAAINNVRQKVARKVTQLERRHPEAVAEVEALGKELKEMGIEPEETYLYIQGHFLFDNVTVPMLTRLCNKLHQEREREIYRRAKHATQRQNELSSYNHSTENVKSMLRRNTNFKQAPPFLRLQADIEHFLEKL